MDKTVRPQLPVHEWIVIATLIGFLLFLAFAAAINNHSEVVFEASHSRQQSIDLEIPLVKHQSELDERRQIKVYLEGASCMRGACILPKGVRWCDIKEHIPVEKEADLSLFEGNKKKLKNEEVIFIPMRRDSRD